MHAREIDSAQGGAGPTPSMLGWGAFVRRHGVAIMMLAGFTALVLPTIGHGLGSVDGQGIVRTVNRFVRDGVITASRPPGHPASEIYFLGPVAKVLAWGGRSFHDTQFLALQWLAAVACGIVFYLWLRRLEIPPLRAAGALGVFLFSPYVLAQTVDGEEFLFGLLCWLAVLHAGTSWLRDGRGRGIAAVAVLLAVASGCRTEILIPGAILFVALTLVRRPSLSQAITATVAGAATLAIIWAPLIASFGIHPPYDPGIAWRDAVFVGGYKLSFDAFGLPVAAVFFGAWVAFLPHFRCGRWRSSVSDVIAGIGVVVIVAMCGAFFFYATKPAVLLTILPFFLLLVVRLPGPWTAAIVLLAAFGCWRQVDVLRDRRVVAPYFSHGAWAAAVARKPYYKREYIEALARAAGGQRVAIVGDVWSWDFDFHLARGTIAGLRAVGRGEYAIGNAPGRLLPRDVLAAPSTLARHRAENYAVLVDRLLWRTVFRRYDRRGADDETAMIGDTPVHLIDVR